MSFVTWYASLWFSNKRGVEPNGSDAGFSSATRCIPKQIAWAESILKMKHNEYYNML